MKTTNRFDEKTLLDLCQGSLINVGEVLGRHEWGENEWVIRAYCPGVKSMQLVAVDDESIGYTMTDKGYDGAFECFIEKSKAFVYAFKCRDDQEHEWTYIDPYQFKPSYRSDELYLFGIGKDYEIYHKLGAHLMCIDGVWGVHFMVWAPRAQRVSVVGAFNNRDGRRHMMHFIPSHGVWALFIPGLCEGDVYQYEIKTDRGELIYKSDPYANYYEVRPLHSSRVFNDFDYKWQDQDWLETRKKKVSYKEAMSIYEVHIGSWRKKDEETYFDYRETAHQLADYVKEMGYTHVELMGIIEHPFDGSWGYQVTGYYAPTSRYGTPDDFKYMVDYLHQNGIGVILDWVPAHFPKDSFALEKFDGHALFEKDDEKQASHPHWGTLIFDYGKPQVRNFLIGSALSWLEKYHIDGLRVDAVASMLYLDYGRDNDFVPNKYGGKENLEAIAFLNELNQVAYERVPGVMMIAEESTAWPKVTYPVSEGGLGFGFKWNMGWMNDFLSYMRTPPAYREKEHGKITFSLMYAFSENFIQVLSHDEVVHEKCCMLYKMPGDMPDKFASLKAAYGFMFMHPGKKMLFMGNELAMKKEWNEKEALDWQLLNEPEHQGVWQFVKALNHVYTHEKALWDGNEGYGNFEWIDCENAKDHVLSFVRKGETAEEDLVIVVNFGEDSWDDYRVGVPHSGEYEEVLNSDDTMFNGSGKVNQGTLRAQMTPWQYRPQSIVMKVPRLGISVLRVKQILSPEVLIADACQKKQKALPKQTVKNKSSKIKEIADQAADHFHGCKKKKRKGCHLVTE